MEYLKLFFVLQHNNRYMSNNIINTSKNQNNFQIVTIYKNIPLVTKEAGYHSRLFFIICSVFASHCRTLSD